jgi:hypothetical protein
MTAFSLSTIGLLVFATVGCGSNQLPVAPVEGQVLYRGKAIESGSVMFQPTMGPPAKGVIKPDGTFRLSTYGVDDGAVIGQHKVRIASVGRQADAPIQPGDSPSEAIRGSRLIPEKYSYFESSGLTAEVKEENEAYVLKLTD